MNFLNDEFLAVKRGVRKILVTGFVVSAAAGGEFRVNENAGRVK